MATTIETTTATDNANQSALEESQRRYTTPPADIFEGETGWLVLVDLPGVARADVHLQYEKDVLTVRAHRDATRGYMRSFGVPKDVDGTQISAKHAHGVLTLTLPTVPAARPLSITVK